MAADVGVDVAYGSKGLLQSEFEGGLAALEVDGEYGAIDPSGKWVIKLPIIFCRVFGTAWPSPPGGGTSHLNAG